MTKDYIILVLFGGLLLIAMYAFTYRIERDYRILADNVQKYIQSEEVRRQQDGQIIYQSVIQALNQQLQTNQPQAEVEGE